MESQDFRSMVEIYGVRFLQYVLNYDREFTSNSNLDDLSLSDEQFEVIEGLEKLLNSVVQIRSYKAFNKLADYLFDLKIGDRSIYNLYRIRCGGNVPEVEDPDPTLDYFKKRAVELYPSLLIKTQRFYEASTAGTGSKLEKNKSEIEKVKSVINADSDISKLVNDDNFYTIRYKLDIGLLSMDWGHSFALNLIQRAFQNCCLRMSYGIEDLLEEVEEQIIKLRKISRGEEIEISMFFGLKGIHLEERQKYSLKPDVIIRNVDSQNNPFPMTNDIIINHKTSDRKYRVGAVMEIKSTTKSLPFKENEELKFKGEKFDSIINNFKTAIIFSLVKTNVPVNIIFRDISIPMKIFHDFGYLHMYSLSDTHANPTIINDNDITILNDWYELLENKDLSNLDIPMKRLKLAIFERKMPIDSLLDGFITWEAMLSQAFETTFKVTASIGKLLEKNPEKRLKFIGRLKKLYGVRSNIVHGTNEYNKFLKKEGIQKIRNEVLEIAIACMKEILKSDKLLLMSPSERIDELLIK